MQQEISFITNPIINTKGFNQFVPILAIQDKTFQYIEFESMSKCASFLNVGIRDISRISGKCKYTCAKGWNFIRKNNSTSIKEEIQFFKKKRALLNITYNIPETRVCSICKEEKLLNQDNFHKSRSNSKYSKLKFKTICIPCRKGEHRNLYNILKNKIQKDPILMSSYLCKTYKRIDTKKGLVFDLTKEWVADNIVGKSCFYCGDIKNIGVERIDNKLGHITTNCVPCCKVCNSSRMDNFTHEEFKEIGLVIKKIKHDRSKAKSEVE